MRERRPFNANETSFSELTTLASCEQKWWELHPSGALDEPSQAMMTGTLLHEAIALWWETGDMPEGAALQSLHNEHDLYLDDESFAKVEWLLPRYVHVNTDVRQYVRVVEHEVELHCQLPHFPVEVWSHLDGLYEIDGAITPHGETALFLVERKSMKTFRRCDLLEATMQEPLYQWQAEQAGLDIYGVMFDAINTYRWKPKKPTQKELIEAELERANGNTPAWYSAEWTTGDSEEETLTPAKAKQAWARAAVEAHPGHDRPDDDSFKRFWLYKTPEQVDAAIRWAADAADRRASLLAGASKGTIHAPGTGPMRNIGPSCHGCPVQQECFEKIGVTMEIELDMDEDDDDDA